MINIATVRPKKSATKGKSGAFVRFNLKMLYISSDAMGMIPETEYISIRVNPGGYVMTITPEAGKGDTAFHLSHVNETKGARRIETNNALLSILDAGFPKWALGKRMPVSLGIDNSLVIDLRPQIPMGEIPFKNSKEAAS